MASREGVTMCDYSSFAKFDVWSAGTEAVEFLQKMCSNDIDIPVGAIIATGMLNEFGKTKKVKILERQGIVGVTDTYKKVKFEMITTYLSRC